MLFKLIKAEVMKLKRSPVWLAFLLMPLIPAVLGTLNYLNNIELLKSEWYSLWTQHTLFTCYFFLPVMVGVYCAYIMRLEHNNRNWNKLLTLPVRRGEIFVAKLSSAAAVILISEIWIGLLFLISGTIVSIDAVPPYSSIAVWCLFGTLGGTVMASIQLTLSIYIKSFALPVGISFGGGLSGLVFLAKGFGHIWPYSLMAYGMNSNSPQQLLGSGYAAFIAICVLFIVLVTVSSCFIMSRKEM